MLIDKTGTLTDGDFRIDSIRSADDEFIILDYDELQEKLNE